MRKRPVLVAAAVSASLACALGGCQNKEEAAAIAQAQALTLASLPPAVRAAAVKETGNRNVVKITKNVGKVATVYEVIYEKDGVNWELNLDPEGNVISNKKD